MRRIELYKEEIDEARTLIKNGEYQKAIDMLEEIYKLNSSNLQVTYDLGRALLISRIDVQRGLKLLNDNVIRNNDLYAVGTIAQYYYDTGMINTARVWLKKIIREQKTEKLGKAFMELGNLEFHTGNFFDAKLYYKKALENKDCYYFARFFLAYIAGTEGDYETSISYCENIIENSDNYVLVQSCYNFLATLYLRLGDYYNAIKYAKKIEKPDSKIKRVVELVVYKETNVINPDMQPPVSYVEYNYFSYSSKAVINHIGKHLNEENLDECQFAFFSDANVEKMYSDAKKLIANAKPTFIDDCDKYIVDLGYDVALIGESNTSKVQVVTYLNSKNIVTMYPVHSCAKCSEVLFKEEIKDANKVSQIDKFNQRYGKRA